MIIGMDSSSPSSSSSSSSSSALVPQFDSNCRVCGDVKIQSCSGPSCHACRVFFYRSAKRYKDLQSAASKYRLKYKRCPTDGNCSINVSNRTNCPDCRLKKCLTAGMTSIQRIPAREWRQDRCLYLTDSEYDEMRTVLSIYSSVRDRLVRELFAENRASRNALVGLGQLKVRMAVYMNITYAMFLKVYKKIPRLASISDCHLYAMKIGLIGATHLNVALKFDPTTKKFQSNNDEIEMNRPRVSDHVASFDLDDAFAQIYGTSVSNKIKRWLLALLQLSPDREIVFLLSLLSFLGPTENDRLSEPSETIASVRAYFSYLLKMYTRHKYGPWDCPRYYDQFIGILDVVRETSRSVLTAPMQLDPSESGHVNEIITKLRRASIGPPRRLLIE